MRGRKSRFRGILCVTLLCLFQPSAGRAFAQGSSAVAAPAADERLPADTCVLEIDVPREADVSIDGKDYGSQRRFEFQPLKPGSIYKSTVELKFSSGESLTRTVSLEGGQRILLAEVDPRAGQPELMLQNNPTGGRVAWSRDGRFIFAGPTMCDAATGRHLRHFPRPVAPPSAIAVHPQSSQVAFASKVNIFSPFYEDTSKVFVYEPQFGELIHAIEAFEGGADVLAYSPDGRYLAVGGTYYNKKLTGNDYDYTGVVKLFDAASGRLVSEIKIGKGVGAISFSPDSRTLLLAEGSILELHTTNHEKLEASLWDVETGSRLRDFLAHESKMTAADFSPDGKRFLTASLDQSIIVWDVANGEQLLRMGGDYSKLKFLGVTGDGTTIVTASTTSISAQRSRFCFWDFVTGQCLRMIEVDVRLDSAAISADAGRLVAGTSDFDGDTMKYSGCLIVIDGTTGEELHRQSFPNEVESVQISPDGRVAFYKLDSGDGREGAFLVDTESGKKLQVMDQYADFAAFSPDGKYVFVDEEFGKRGSLWNVSTARRFKEFEIDRESTPQMNAAAISYDSRLLAIGTEGDEKKLSRLLLYDIESGELLRSMDCFEGYVEHVAFSKDGKRLFVQGGYSDKRSILWETETGNRLKIFNTESSLSTITPDGDYVLTEADELGSIWSVETEKPVRKFGAHRDNLQFARFSNDGSKIVSAGYYSIRHDEKSHEYTDAVVWNATSGRQVHLWDGLEGSSVWFDMSPDGRFLVDTRDNRQVTDLETGQSVRQLHHGAGAVSIKVADGRRLLGQISRADGHDWVDFLTGRVAYTTPGSWMEYSWDKSPTDSEAVAVSVGGEFMVSKTADHSLVLRSLRDGTKILRLPGIGYQIIDVVASADGRYVAATANNTDYRVNESRILVWDVNSGRLIHRLSGHDSRVTSQPYVYLRISNQGDKLYSFTDRIVELRKGALQNQDYDNIRHVTDAYIWDLGSGRRLATLPEDRAGSEGGLFSLDGTQILTDVSNTKESSSLKRVAAIVWDVRTGREVRQLVDTSEEVGSLTNGAFSSDGHILATVPFQANDRGRIKIWHWPTGRLLRTMSHEEGKVDSLQFLPDTRLLLANQKEFWNAMTGKRLAQFRGAGMEGEWVALTPEGLFDGTVESRQQVTFRAGGGLNVVPVERFFQDFYQPGLIPQVLTGRVPLPQISLGGKLAPAVEIVEPESIESTDTPRVTVQVKVTDRGGGIKGPWIKHNGARILASGEETREGESVFRTFHIALVEGENQLEFSAATQDGAWESEPVRTVVSYRQETSAASFHLVSIGINRYAEETMNLKYASSDARSIVELFEQRGPTLFGKSGVHTTLLMDEDATREKVLQTLKDVAGKVNPQDTFCLFLAGHGTMVGQRYFFIPHEFEETSEKLEDDITAQGIAGDELDDAINRVPALKRIVIYDTCQSGGVIEISRTARNPFQFRKALESMSRSQGSFIIAATAASDDAHEISDLGHGVLTYALLAAMGAVDKGPLKARKLKGKEDSKLVGVRSWLGFAQDEVPLLTRSYFGEEQFIRFTGSGSDFPVLPAKE